MRSQGHVEAAPPYSSKDPLNLIMGGVKALIQPQRGMEVPPRVTRALGMLSAPLLTGKLPL